MCSSKYGVDAARVGLSQICSDDWRGFHQVERFAPGNNGA
ncbi:hypothetical protein BURCENBC7_AP1960 [Burkholderia cenocepacia BC7]|nr:hypothetical protein BURCENK562V_C7128 [Burkholderia cenocepacia K56-2Valvano]ERI29390.1 hypothetical protein BURCENBC7_AP1960 [Burkholderia cenocepacia BC7]